MPESIFKKLEADLARHARHVAEDDLAPIMAELQWADRLDPILAASLREAVQGRAIKILRQGERI